MLNLMKYFQRFVSEVTYAQTMEEVRSTLSYPSRTGVLTKISRRKQHSWQLQKSRRKTADRLLRDFSLPKASLVFYTLRVYQSSSLDRVEQETLTLNNEGTRKLPCSLFSYCILSSATGFAEEQREIVTPRAFASLNWKRNSSRSTDNLVVIRKLTTIDEKIKNNRSKRVILVIRIERSKLLDTLNFDKKTSYKIRLATSLIFLTENFVKFSRSKFRLSGRIIVTSEPYYSGQLLPAVSFCFVS